MFLPQWRKCRPNYPHVMTNREILDKLEREGYLVYTPSRRIGSKLVASYDDRYIFNLLLLTYFVKKMSVRSPVYFQTQAKAQLVKR